MSRSRRSLLAVLVLGAAAASLLACGDDGSVDAAGDAGSEDAAPSLADLEPFGPFDEAAVEITGPDGAARCACVLLADRPEQRNRGLMGVTDLEGYAGMLFAFESDTTSRFFMKDTPMPLSIAWFDAGGAFVSSADMDPCLGDQECPRFEADGPYRYALEVPQGDLAEVGVRAGSSLEIVDDCP